MPIGIDAVHRLVGEHAGLADRGAEQGGLAVLADSGRGEILIKELLELVMRRHFVALAAFLMQPHPPALAAGGNSPRHAWRRRRRCAQTSTSSPPSARGCCRGRDMKGGVEVACAEALSAELHSSFSNVGIERVFQRTKPARCCPECCPNLARDDQRVRSFHLTL
jgi:hypothetical protein